MKRTLQEEKKRILQMMKQLNEWYDDEYYEKPEFKHGIGKFENIDWRVLFDVLIDNLEVATTKNSAHIGANYGDLTDHEGMLSPEELRHLESFGLVEKMGSFPVIGYKYKDFEAFYNTAKEIWDKEAPVDNTPPHYEEPYLRGREPES